MNRKKRWKLDDRRSLREEATLDALSPALVRNFLNDVKSRLLYPEINDYELYRDIGLIARVNGHEVPKNIALLFFCNEPGKYFPKVQIDVVQFADGEGGDLSTALIQKLPTQAESMRTL
ncbi:MAG: hypothetical protein GY862_15350 [Gammaproteobacteria bacterium]|nr:hypothetical protein [Gammaproteobacteria bacterium]